MNASTHGNGHGKEGHNSKSITAGQLQSFVERVERLETEKAGLTTDIGAVYSEAKSAGFDVPAMREIVRKRRMDAAKRAEREALVELYEGALSDLKDTPLGNAAIERIRSGAEAA